MVDPELLLVFENVAVKPDLIRSGVGGAVTCWSGLCAIGHVLDIDRPSVFGTDGP